MSGSSIRRKSGHQIEVFLGEAAMNWDISTGRMKQSYGRVLQMLGRRFAQRRMVLEGEAVEYAGRLQTRYGVLKHQVQWSHVPLRLGRASLPVRGR